MAILPERVRRDVVELAAEVLGALDEAEVPAALRRVRAFAPLRRARTGAGPLGVALERDAAFRQRVAAVWRAQRPELAPAVDDGELPAAADPAEAAAGAYLVRPPGWPELLAAALGALAAAGDEQRRQELAASASADLEAARRDAERWQAAAAEAEAARAELAEEVARLRRDGRKQRADADRARAAAREAEQRLAGEREALSAAAAAHEEAARTAGARAREAEQLVDDARRAAREGRSAADARARLLLDTIVDAAAGLRRELALPPADRLPGDVVAASLAPAPAGPGVPGPPPRALAADDPAVLDELLALPQVHLIVDGYNVTKAGYPALTLVQQRNRLVDGLAAVAARTGAEVTCCFDGADVESRGPARVRGVRVLFSEPGMTADELIRRLVRAEPEGRVLVVVSSDGEVASGVTASGARAVASAALLRLLGRAPGR